MQSLSQPSPEPTQSYAATDIPIQPVENGTPSHSSAILSQVPVSETETHAIDSISRRDPPTIMEISAATTGEPESTLQPVDVHPIRVESESFSIHLPEIEVHPRISDQSEETVWGGMPYNELCEKVNTAYEKIAKFRKNLFRLPSGKVGKDFVLELAFWLRQFNRATKLNGIALKMVMIIPALLIQKTSAKSKAKQHTESLRKRLELWRKGDLTKLLQEAAHIQAGFKKPKVQNPDEAANHVSKRFAKFMSEGNISAALKLLDNNASTGVLKLTDEVMDELRKKHPKPAITTFEPLLSGPTQPVPSYFFDCIDEQTILKAAKETKGSGGPSGIDAEQFRRFVCSKNFAKEGKMLREEIAELARRLASTHYDPLLLDAYTSCRLIPLAKNPGIRPIGISEVLRRIVGKAVSRSVSQQVKEAAGPLQTCAGHRAGAEAAVHSMQEIFKEEGTDGILLIDASNAFNCLNRNVALHNIRILCPAISTYIINTYRHYSTLYVAGGEKLLSMEGTTQGDPLAMAWYSLSTVVLIDSLKACIPLVKQVWLADDATAAGNVKQLKAWYDKLIEEGQKMGYNVNRSKSWLIVKNEESEARAHEEFGDTVNITTEGQRHLGAVIGSPDFKISYCNAKATKWIEELTNLNNIAETHPHMAYVAFTKGYLSKFTYFMRTIEGFDQFLSPIDDVLDNKFIPTLFGTDAPPAELREVLELKSSDGGLGMPRLEDAAKHQLCSSRRITSPHVAAIISQRDTMLEQNADGRTLDDLLLEDRSEKLERRKQKIKDVDEKAPMDMKPFILQARDRGASSWLNAMPIEELDFQLNKEEFRDAIRLRYNMNLDNLPTYCPCGHRFNVSHALECKKGGFIHERHDNIKDTLTKLLSRVCHDVESEPHLIPVTNERFQLKSANATDDARLDIKAKSFWTKGQTAFFDVRITHVNSSSQSGLPTEKVFRQHEMAKRREYMQRILEVENGSFTPLVFGTNGGLGEECTKFLGELAAKIAKKDDDSYAHTITWIRTRLSFDIMKSSLACIRGSRTPFRRADTQMCDFELMARQCDLARIC